uniref:Plant heme peroxidase family profile domain-containing protein n=1 Tax=Nelumbo nucifera TaxID=4432 RepID=A0A822Z7M7_NELNU|nr:TPA_asm: hypothetical protein HUJ06_014866 [Nelumbo nucifera]
MDKFFSNQLKLACPTATTDLDIQIPNVFDSKYYVDLMNQQGLFTSNQDLYTDLRTRPIVTSFALNQTPVFEKFVYAMLKMGQLSVLTGTQGEIRANYSARNSTSTDEEQGGGAQHFEMNRVDGCFLYVDPGRLTYWCYMFNKRAFCVMNFHL